MTGAGSVSTLDMIVLVTAERRSNPDEVANTVDTLLMGLFWSRVASRNLEELPEGCDGVGNGDGNCESGEATDVTLCEADRTVPFCA